MSDYRELLERAESVVLCVDAEWMRVTVIDLQKAIRALQEQVKEYDKSILKYLDGDYPRPRNYRPEDCPHGVRHWKDCSNCDSAYWESERKRIDAMGVKGD